MKKMFVFSGILAGLLCSMAFAAVVEGDCDLSLSAPEGATWFTMRIAIDGDNATGHVGETVLSGTYVDETPRLKSDYCVIEAGYISKLDLDVRLEGEQLKGRATWDMQGADDPGQRPE